MAFAQSIIDMGTELMKKFDPNDLKELFKYIQGMDFGDDSTAKTLDQFLNEVRYKDGVYCPHCGVYDCIKKGHTHAGKQRYYCRTCHATFTASTKSVFENCKLSLQVLKELAACMLNKMSIHQTMFKTGLASKTILDWRHKMGFCLNQMQEHEIVMGQIVETDETYIRDSYKGNHYMPDRPKMYVPCKSNNERVDIAYWAMDHFKQDVKVGYRRKGVVAVYVGPFKRPDDAFEMPRPPRYCKGKKKRGLSASQQCLICAVDRQHNAVALPVGMGNCTYNQIELALHNRIEPQSVLCTDSKPGYTRFAQNYDLAIQLFKGQNRVNGIYGIQNINNYHSQLDKLIYGNFYAVSGKHISDYTSLCNFADYALNKVTLNNIDYKVKHLMEICASKLVNFTGKMIGARNPMYFIS